MHNQTDFTTVDISIFQQFFEKYLTFNPVIKDLQNFDEMVYTAFKHTGCKHSRVTTKTKLRIRARI